MAKLGEGAALCSLPNPGLSPALVLMILRGHVNRFQCCSFVSNQWRFQSGTSWEVLAKRPSQTTGSIEFNTLRFSPPGPNVGGRTPTTLGALRTKNLRPLTSPQGPGTLNLRTAPKLLRSKSVRCAWRFGKMAMNQLPRN